MSKGLLVLLLLLVTACSSTPLAVNYYMLANNPSEPRAGSVQTGSTPVTLTKLVLAKYLGQPNLALLQGEHQINYANKHVWAEPLQHGLARALVNDFNRSDSARLVLAGDPGASDSEFQIQLRVDHFLPTDGGQVVLGGQYWLLKKDKVLATENFLLSEVLGQDGYAHAVEVQRQLVGQLAEQLVVVVTQF